MRFAVTLVNFILGGAYVSIGVLIAYDLVRGLPVRGFSHFGASLTLVAWTCGAHHLIHGFHVAFEGHASLPLDFVSVLVGLPFGAVFYALRVEALFGGRGDRFVSGSPSAVTTALPVAAVGYLTAVYFGLGTMLDDRFGVSWPMTPQLLLVGIYATIAYVLLRTQIHNHRSLGGWSLSGGAMTGIFFSCSTMHLVLLAAAVAGRPVLDAHTTMADVAAVPAGLYFLAVVGALYRGAIRDWNRSAVDDDAPSLALAGSAR